MIRDVFTILKVVMVSQVYTTVKTHQILCFVYVKLIHVSYSSIKLPKLSEDIMNFLQIHFKNYVT